MGSILEPASPRDEDERKQDAAADLNGHGTRGALVKLSDVFDRRGVVRPARHGILRGEAR
jgi:hypothetical protein